MKHKWNEDQIEKWMTAEVTHPSSEFQRKSEAWLRSIRNQSHRSPSTNWMWALLGMALPITAAAAIAIVLLNQNAGPHADPTIDGLNSKEILAYQELVEMDELLGESTVMLDQEQLDLLEALSTLPDLSDALAMISYPTNT